ncbi:MAG TPA: hypothetical protein VMM17_05680 [Gemmatimonadaceae bacterium]|nr:hypothetical protein [Gemmatimonadaceae bacterium]
MRALLLAMAAGVPLMGCARETVGPEVPVAVALESLPFPAVVAGDSLRDTTGAVVPVRGQVFNYLGEELPDVPLGYLILDRGATIDATTGVVRGDSIRETPVRVVAFLEGLQTQAQQLFVVPAPDALAITAGNDTLEYSLVDTTVNVSDHLAVRLLSAGATPVGIRGWIVSYQITHSASPALAILLGDGSTESAIDTTAADGGASRRLRVRPEELTATADSVVVLATARYRGAHVNGSPARLVVHLRPRPPQP